MKILATLAACVLFHGSAANGSAQILSFNGTIEAADPLQTGRIVRNGIASTAGTTKPFPGLNDSNPRHYDLTSFTNTFGFDVDYLITMVQPSTELFHLAYLNAFNPADISANYFGDAGSSTPTASYSLRVPAGATVFLVIHEVNQNAGLGASYSLTVDTLVAVPEPGTWAAGMLLVGATGGALVRRRRAAVRLAA